MNVFPQVWGGRNHSFADIILVLYRDMRQKDNVVISFETDVNLTPLD